MGPHTPHACQGQVPDDREIADVDPVHDAVKHADQLGQHGWNGQPAHQREHRITAQVIGSFHRMIRHLLYTVQPIIPLFLRRVKGVFPLALFNYEC